MNVFHVVESLDRGGLERVVIDLGLAQRAAGYDVVVCCLFEVGQLAQELIDGGVPVSCAFKGTGFDLRAVTRLNRMIKQANASVVHTHNAMSNYYGALAVLPRPGLRLINSRHGMGAISGDRRKERLYRISLLRTSAVAVVCAAARDHFASNGLVPWHKLRVIRNGIRLDNFDSCDPIRRKKARMDLEIADDAYVIGTVGRLNWAKDQAMLIDSFAQMHPRQPGDKLVIVGGGELREHLEARIRSLALQESVLLLGDRNDVADILPAFDVFAATSVTEGHSIALLEAAATGIPVVASNVGGNAEIVQHRETGLLVEERSALHFARVLGELGQTPETRRQMGQRAHAWARTNAGLMQSVKAYERLYRSDTVALSTQDSNA